MAARGLQGGRLVTPKEERQFEAETVLNFNLLEKTWVAYTSIPKHARMFERLGWTYDKLSKEWQGPKGNIKVLTFKNLKRPARKLSNEERERRAILMRSVAAKRVRKAPKQNSTPF